MKTINYIKLIRLTAALSFITGTVIFLLYKINHAFFWIEIGLAYIFIAFIINCIVLLVVLIQASIYYKDGSNLFYNSLLMLINIPIVILYITLL